MRVPGAGSASPDDPEKVRSAFRLGWAIAELRGRYRPDFRVDEFSSEQASIARTGHALPLSNERTPAEQRIEVSRLVDGLASALNLESGGTAATTTMNGLKPVLRTLERTPDDRVAWDKLANGLYRWDADIQDKLALVPSQSAAYQLGRGLAESRWALDVTCTDSNDPRSFELLLGARRRATLKRLLARLVGYMDPLTLPAVSGSLDAWGELASDAAWRRQEDVRPKLDEQALLWRDLIRGERRPGDLIAGTNALQQVGLLPKLVPLLWPQLLLGALALAAFVGGAIALASGAKNVGLATAFGVLGGLGITSASLYGRAKASALSLLAGIRDATERERVGRAATRRPQRIR